MDNSKHVLESFSEFLKYRDMELNEKEGSPLDLAGAKDLVKLIMEYNAKLATDLYEKSEGIKGEYLREAAKCLTEEKYALAGVYSMIGNIVTKQITKESFEVLKALIPSVTDEDYKDYELTKNRRTKSSELLKSLSKITEEDAKKLAPDAIKKISKDKEGNYIASAIKTPFIWGGLLSTAEQDKAYEAFLSEATKKGYETKEGLKKVIDSEFKDKRKEDGTRMQSPGLTAFLDKTESSVVKPGAPVVKETKTAIVEEADEDEVFKPNMYGANGEADYMEGTYKKMLDNLGAIFQRLLTGEVSSIKSITVHTSADRYRNTGEAEKLSWGQLSYLRATSMASLVVSMATKSGLQESVVSKINSMIMLNFKGQNGDGTSGPNPPEPLKFGYYISDKGKSIWKEGKDRNMIDVLDIDNEGTPSGEPKQVKKSPEADKNDYNVFRYNNIEIVYEAVEKGTTEEPTGVVEKIVDLAYPIKIRIPARYRRKTIKIPLPYITIGAKSVAGKGRTKPTVCPDFSSGGGGGGIKTKFGIGIKQVTIASWQSDLTK
jgi:hypothetical protein